MLFSDFAEMSSVRHICGPEAIEYNGVYVGDLLSRAMGRIEAGNLWITIMNNINVIAVSSLADASAVILAEHVLPTDDAISAAQEKGISVYSTPLSAYELCRVLAHLNAAV